MDVDAIITIGLPGCGKSTWAANLPAGVVRIERDMIRSVLHKDRTGEPFSWARWDFSREGEVQRAWAEALDRAIRAGARLVVSDTNLNPRFRRELVAQLRRAGFSVRYVFFDVPESVCRTRNAQRQTQVSPEAYDRLRGFFEEARTNLASEALELGVQLEVIN